MTSGFHASIPQNLRAGGRWRALRRRCSPRSGASSSSAAASGADDREAVARIERELVQQFNRSGAALAAIASTSPNQRDLIRDAAADEAAARGLFEALERAAPRRHGDRPRASAFTTRPASRSRGPGAFRICRPNARRDRPRSSSRPMRSGLRLVRVQPVVDGRRASRRRPASGRSSSNNCSAPTASTPAAADTFMMPASIAPVSVRAAIGDAQRRSDYAFVIPSSDGQVLVEAEIAPADLADARARWRSQTVGWVLAVLGADDAGLHGAAARRAPPSTRRSPAPGGDRRPRRACSLAAATCCGWRRSGWSKATPPGRSTCCSGRCSWSRSSWLALDLIERRRVAAPRPRLHRRHARRAGAGVRGGRGARRIARLGVRPLPAEHRLAHDARPAPLLAAPAERVAHRDRLRPDSAPRRRVLERRAHAARDRGGLAAAPQRDAAARPRPAAWIAGALPLPDAATRIAGPAAADAAPARARRDRRRARSRSAGRAGTDPPRLADGEDGRDLRRAGRAVAGHVSVAAGVHDRGQGSAGRRTVWPGGAAAARRPADEPESRRRGNRRAAVAERIPDRAGRRNRVDRRGLSALVEDRSGDGARHLGGRALSGRRAAREPLLPEPARVRDHQLPRGRLPLGRHRRKLPDRIERAPRPPRQPRHLPERPAARHRGRARDARLPRAALHLRTHAVSRVVPHSNRAAPPKASAGRDLEFVWYGWSRAPLYVSGTSAWPLPGSRVRARRPVARAVLGRRRARRPPVSRALPQRSQRDLRARLSPAHAVRSRRQSRGARHARLRAVPAAARRLHALQRRSRRARRPADGRCCARCDRASIASCSSPSCWWPSCRS